MTTLNVGKAVAVLATLLCGTTLGVESGAGAQALPVRCGTVQLHNESGADLVRVNGEGQLFDAFRFGVPAHSTVEESIRACTASTVIFRIGNNSLSISGYKNDWGFFYLPLSPSGRVQTKLSASGATFIVYVG